MTSPYLKQFALACTPKGEIGKEDELLFTSSVDLARFKAFTRKTVMIVGRKTAQQMIDAKVRLHERAMVVVSEEGLLTDTTGEQIRKIVYAANFDQAIRIAQRIAELEGYLGWTIVGGKSIYEQMFDQLDKGNLRINRAYMFVTDLPDWAIPSVPVKLNRDVAQIVSLVCARMTEESVKIQRSDTVLNRRVSSFPASPFRGTNGAVYNIVDKGQFDFENVSYETNGVLNVKSGGNNETIVPHHIVGYSYRQDVDSVEVRLSNGHTVSLRPGSKAAVNALLLTLQSF